MQIRLLDALAPKTPLSEPTVLHYVQDLVANKGSIFYRAHSYHTKVPPEGIARLIDHYTSPGDTVADPFCGSGMTGIACLLTGRYGLLSDLSPAAVHIARNYVMPANAHIVRSSGNAILSLLQEAEKQLYSTDCVACRHSTVIEYSVWSDIFACPACGEDISFWHQGLSSEKQILPCLTCPNCGTSTKKKDATWKKTLPVVISYYCQRCRKRRESDLSTDAQTKVLAYSRAEIDAPYPEVPFESWREMWRGQHRDQGIRTSADFFTNRNLGALALLWREIGKLNDARTREALQFVFTSIVNRASRRYQWNAKGPTNVLTSTLYISSLSYEFNVFSLFRRKLKIIADLYEKTCALSGSAEVRLSPAQDLGPIPTSSVDYVFTDPPFGSNIFYSDASFLWESWLGTQTDTRYETVVHKSQVAAAGGKSLGDYEILMASALEEIGRILKPKGVVSLMFHNSDDAVWSALQRAIETAGFAVESAIAFDKNQPSFKGVKGLTAGERVAGFDIVLQLEKTSANCAAPIYSSTSNDMDCRGKLIARLREHLTAAPPKQRSTPYLHSLAMRFLLEEGLPTGGFSYGAIEALCVEQFHLTGSLWAVGAE